MSLSAREQRALEDIEDTLSGSDNELASMLATFTRLTCGEEMPAREKIRAAGAALRVGRSPRPSRLRPAPERASRHARRLAWHWPWSLLWLLVAAGLIALAVIVNQGGTGACPNPWSAGCARYTPAHLSRPAAHGIAADQAPRIAR